MGTATSRLSKWSTGPGTDNSEEIAIVRRSLESAGAKYERGEYRYSGSEEDYQARKGRLSLPR
jgi:hypothetical protein